jgi:hypothetical protein
MAETHENLLSVRGRQATALGATFRTSHDARIAPHRAEDSRAKSEAPLIWTLTDDPDGWGEGSDSDGSV